MPVARTSNRSSPKQRRILTRLREQIITGELSPGVRLPTRSRLERRFNASPITVQRVFDKLTRDGFVDPRGRNGTFVAERPPHLTRFGLVFLHRPMPQHPWSLFYKALLQEAQTQVAPGSETIAAYYSNFGETGSSDYRTLEADVLAHRVGGLIFVFPPFELDPTPVIKHPGVPRVCIARLAHGEMPGVGPDVHGSFFDRAFVRLAEQGRRRVALITPATYSYNHARMFEAARNAGVEIRPHWFHVVGVETPMAARGVTNLLARLPADDRPDALVVSDDNLLDESLAGLAASGVRLPDGMTVLSHWNFPNDPPRVLPVTYLGFDCRRMIRGCLDVLHRQRRGEPVEPATALPALFEDEWRGQISMHVPAN